MNKGRWQQVTVKQTKLTCPQRQFGHVQRGINAPMKKNNFDSSTWNKKRQGQLKITLEVTKMDIFNKQQRVWFWL